MNDPGRADKAPLPKGMKNEKDFVSSAVFTACSY